MAALVVLNDLNGNHYLGTQEGETLVRQAANVVYFPEGMPVAQNALATIDITQKHADLFMQLNIYYLRQIMLNGQRVISDTQAAVIAFHRLLAVKEGLISSEFDPANYHVDYDETEEVETTVINGLQLPDLASISGWLSNAQQHDIASTFVDRVSMVAFVFRARGHHYMDSYEALYRRIWGKCRYKEEKLHISFAHLSTFALHAIFPVILDDFWKREVDALHVNGALAKRIDVAPAGAAGPYVLDQGIRDLVMVAPGIRDRLEEAVQYLNGVLNALRAHRFAGSVNARFYGAQKVAFDEKRLSSIAATIVAALDNLTEDAPLAQSPALRRIASNAPITGAILGRAIGNISNRPEVVNTLLIANRND